MQRIMIIGQPGSGKSTLARALGAKTGLPVVHIDHIHWQSGWVERSHPEKSRLCNQVEAGERWIFEGGHSATWENRATRADMIIWLDLPLGLRYRRVFWRTLRWLGQTRPDLPQGCREGLHRETLAFWHFIWRTRHKSRANMARLFARYAAEKPCHHLTSQRQIDAFVQDWSDGIV